MNEKDIFNYFLPFDNNGIICRICLRKFDTSDKLISIHENYDKATMPFSTLVMACASVQVMEGDGLPSLICLECTDRLNIAYSFKIQCEESDRKLRNIFSQTSEGQNSLNDSFDAFIEYEPVKKTEDHIDYELNEQNVLLLPNLIEPSPEPKSDSSKISETKDKDRKKRFKRRSSNIHQCETCGKIFRTKTSLVLHIRIHTGERPYMCHLCEKRFVNGGHLHTHMRTHTGEKNYRCASCPKAFATAQQLTKHVIAIHTLERPYACSYCSKRFASSSNLRTHIKIHTGEKNYQCDQCAKAFYTKGQLYQHLLVHTGEKAFNCLQCNKRFSQKAHLIRHSKLHTKNKDKDSFLST